MAVLLRTVSSLGRVTCSSGAATRMWCGISKPNASFFNDLEASFCKSKNNAGFSQSADLPARCQAIGAVCPLPTRQAVLERPIEVENFPSAPEARPETIDQHAAPLPRSFLAESVSGNLVECSGRGSRPLYSNVLAEFQTSFDQAELLMKADHNAVKKAFHAALASAPGDARLLSQFAAFTWKFLGDLDAAEELYNKALELAPHDPDIQATHALFLWQCDS